MADDCLFCRMASGTIAVPKLIDDDQVFAIRDINPRAPVHVLIIPKGAYVSSSDFSAKASAEEIAGFTRAIRRHGWRACGDASGSTPPESRTWRGAAR